MIETMVDAIVQQRDMYRALLAAADARHADPADDDDDDDDDNEANNANHEDAQDDELAAAAASSSKRRRVRTADADNDASERALIELRGEFQRYREERAALETTTRDASDQLRSALVEARVAASRAAAEADFERQRREQAEARLDERQRELSALRDQVTRDSTLLIEVCWCFLECVS
jgi:DNA repair exonuclease SbcCD ATPase subunit